MRRLHALLMWVAVAFQAAALVVGPFVGDWRTGFGLLATAVVLRAFVDLRGAG